MKRPWGPALAWAAAAVLLPAAAQAGAKPIQHFTAFAVDMSGAARMRTGTIDIAVERWTTDQERDRLAAALKEGGTEALLRELRKVHERVGYIRTATSTAYPLRFAREIPLPDGGRRLLLATDRRLSFLELSSSSRTLDYPFLVLDIRLDAKGEGSGKLLPLARVEWDGETVVEIENWANEPVRLTSVRMDK